MGLGRPERARPGSPPPFYHHLSASTAIVAAQGPSGAPALGGACLLQRALPEQLRCVQAANMSHRRKVRAALPAADCPCWATCMMHAPSRAASRRPACVRGPSAGRHACGRAAARPPAAATPPPPLPHCLHTAFDCCLPPSSWLQLTNPIRQATAPLASSRPAQPSLRCVLPPCRPRKLLPLHHALPPPARARVMTTCFVAPVLPAPTARATALRTRLPFLAPNPHARAPPLPPARATCALHCASITWPVARSR